MRHYRVALVAILALFFCGNSVGQSTGWQLLQENELLEAKKNFEKELLQNENDEDALCGMLFVTEVLQDQLNYKKYANQLINSTWKDEYFFLFKHLYEGSSEDILKHKLDASLLVKPTLILADSLFYHRNFSKSISNIRSVTQDFNWSVIGAFENISGSGHLESQPLEKENFKPQRNYNLSKKVGTNESEFELKWVQRHQRSPSGKVSFNENLAYMRDGTYYANTFVTMPKTQTVQLRIARTTPLKIWVDDDLIFDKNNNIKYVWDGEMIVIRLEKGMHRILVKASTYVEEAGKSELYLSFNDQFDEDKILVDEVGGFGENHFYNKMYANKGNRPAGFALRITDPTGKLIDGVKSDFFGKNKTHSYQPRLVEKQWIQVLQNKIKRNPNDWKNYYLLNKMFLLMELGEEGEEWFYPVVKQQKDKFYFKFLFAKLYAANDKGELAEALLSDLDFYKTPVVATLVSHLQKIDKKNNAASYHSKIKQILNLSPTHQEAVIAYLRWMTDNGKEEDKKKYVRIFLAKYPNSGYKNLFLKFLTTNRMATEDFKNESPLQVERNGLQAIAHLKKHFDSSDYLDAIEYYKKKRNHKKVVKLYDELIGKFPYRIYYLKEKAAYLFEKNKLDEAITNFEKIIEINPYHARTLEKIGDIYLQKKDKTTAVQYFQKAKILDHATLKGNFALKRIREKIEKITGSVSSKKYFQHFTTEELQKNKSWENKYEKDESLILMYNIQATLNENNRLNYHQKLWIKILNTGGANYWTEADFSFLGEIGMVKVIKPDGSEVTPSRNWNLVVFKNLQPGDIIHIEGFSNGDMTREIPNEMYHITWLSMEVPIYRSVFELILPKEKQVNYKSNRVSSTPKIRTENNVKIYTWEIEHTPKNEHEEAILNNMDKFAWIMLSTQKDWKKIVKWYESRTYRRWEANYDVKNKLEKIVHKNMTSKEKVQAVYNYLTSGITYSHVGFLNSNYTPKKPAQTICSGIGDCKDVASLMIAMLRELDIEAHYVLVRTSDYTHHEPRPSVLAFDHVVVGYRLEDKVMRYADLTTDYFSSEVLPEFDNDQWALLIKPNESQLFRLPNDQLDESKNYLKIKTRARVAGERNLEMQIKMEANGVVAGSWRSNLNNKTTNNDQRGFLTKSLASAGFDHLKIMNFSFDHLQELDSVLLTEMELKAFHHLEKVSNFQILQIPILYPITTRTALFDELRHNDLALGKLFNIAPCEQVIDLHIPTGNELLEIPADVILENKFGKYSLRFHRIKNGVRVHRKLVFKQHFVAKEDYMDFKSFYLKLMDGDQTKLAIRKRVMVVKQ